MFCLVVMTSTLLAIGVPGFALAADPPAVPDARKLVERSLPFLEKEAVAWVAEKKCVTCHHVPMMLWTHYEAKRRGFAVNENAAKELQGQALTQYLGHAELMPTAQDASFLEKPLGPGTVYLSLAIKAHPSPGGEVQKALHRLTANFVKHQNEDGSWTTKLNQPPMIDGHDVTTMLILLAMSTGPEGERRDVWERALTWLKSEPMREETQAMALRLLIAIRCGNRQEVQRLASLLRFKQREDGGWGQTPDLRSDALATGQALYALSAARTSA
ncbi:MAG: prenyltransferase/squalene oxidase repeat-containing protein, partial [Pirellulales bacterium]